MGAVTFSERRLWRTEPLNSLRNALFEFMYGIALNGVAMSEFVARERYTDSAAANPPGWISTPL